MAPQKAIEEDYKPPSLPFQNNRHEDDEENEEASFKKSWMNRCHYLATSLLAQTMIVKRRLLPLKSNFLLTFPGNTFSKIWTIGIASSSFMIYIVKYCCSSPLLQVAVAHCILYNIHTQTWILCGILKPLLKSGINHCHCFLKRETAIVMCRVRLRK